MPMADRAAGETLREGLGFVLPWLGLVLALAVPMFLLWRSLPSGRGLLPAQRHRAVLWDFLHAVGAALLPQLLVLWLAPARPSAPLLAGAADVWAQTASNFAGGEGLSGLLSPLAAYAVRQEELATLGRRVLVVQTLVTLAQIAAVLAFAIGLAGGRLYQLGLTLHRWRQDVISGYIFWLVLTPGVFAIYLGAVLILGKGTHPVELILQSSNDRLTWLLTIVFVLVLAPIAEELLFRGLLQQWMVRSPSAADAALVASLVCAVMLGVGGSGIGPLAFLLSVGPGYLAFERLASVLLPRPGAARAIYASSLLFAVVHAQAWPTPIPLFFLALGLGYLAYRTQSLIGPIVMHSLFNAVTVIQLLWARTAGS
jgi:membrane protease YdiL (CAAX protease family)